MTTCLLITTWNRTPQLRRGLQRLSELTLPDEILIVDDGGTDGCDQVPAEFPHLPIRYEYLDNPGLNLSSYPRNFAIHQTDADLVVISEPEMYFITDAIPQLVEGWRQTRKVVSAGTVYHAQDEWMQSPEQCNRIEGWVAAYTGIYERQALLDVGGWDTTAPAPWGWEDVDLLTRLRIFGIGQEIDRSIEVMHMWHVNPGRDDYGALANDAWFKAKKYDDDPDVVVVNRDAPGWGKGLAPR